MNHKDKRITKGYKGIIGMDGFIAYWYDKNARKNQIVTYKAFIQRIIPHLKNGISVLDVAPGPGYLTIELSRLGNFDITGLDISRTFVEIAKRNAADAGKDIRFELGDAAYMPFPNDAFNFIICTAAFKNFSQPVKVLREMYRVLKPHGMVCISDLRHDASDEMIDDYVKNSMKAEGFASFFMKWSFKSFLRNRAYTKDQLSKFISETKFKNYTYKENSVELDIWLKK